MSLGKAEKPPGRCLLLELPPELRYEIYQYIIPTTIVHASKDIYWIRAKTALLAVSRQIHNEAAHIMYGQLTFVFNIVWNRISFDCSWQPHNPWLRKKINEYPQEFPHRYLRFMQHFRVNVEVSDGDAQIVRANPGFGAGLKHLLRGQVECVCRALEVVPSIASLRVRFRDRGDDPEMEEMVLEPFLELGNVRAMVRSRQ